MKKVVIVGGRLQGLETLYLAGKAGMYTTLIDKDPAPIGQNFCNRFIYQDVIQYNRALLSVFQEADFVLPALENDEALDVLLSLKENYGVNLIYDPAAYAISSSKARSDQIMSAAGIPVPLHYPSGKMPYIAKPSSLSGSEGVVRLDSQSELAAFLNRREGDDWVIEEYLTGPSYSIEIIGVPGNYRVYHITELFMDQFYDCKRVFSCPDFPSELKGQFEALAFRLGELVQLHGIMDVEVIDDNGILKVLEIDVRHPSQTPITIYHATGVNFMAELHRYFCPGSDFALPEQEEREIYVSLEQLEVKDGYIDILGEHVLTKAQGLYLSPDFCGADEAITNYQPDKSSWVAAVICKADSAADLERKRQRVFKNIETLSGMALVVRDLLP